MDSTLIAAVPSPSAPGAAPQRTAYGVTHGVTVELVRDLSTLARLAPLWDELAVHALEPNVFYEHWMLLPALAAYGAGGDVGVAVVRTRPRPQRAATLAGLFPLRLRRHSGRPPLGAWRLWRHPHCYLGTPLVRADCAAECIDAFLCWSRASGAALVELPSLCADGPFARLLRERCTALRLPGWATDRYLRGLWCRRDARAGGVASAVSADLRRRLRRKERRMAAHGRLEHRATIRDGDIGRWTEEFLCLEAGGWKGRRGSALACSPPDRTFFTEIVAQGFRRRRLLTLSLDYDRRPVARRCAFIAGEGSYAFKTAYDERFARYSPGAILELDSLAQLQALPSVGWMDSCAAHDNDLINRIANSRRAIHNAVIACSPLGRLMFAGQKLLRAARRCVRPGTLSQGHEVKR